MGVAQTWVAEADDEEGVCGSGGIAFVYFQHSSGADGGRAPDATHIDLVGVPHEPPPIPHSTLLDLDSDGICFCNRGSGDEMH